MVFIQVIGVMKLKPKHELTKLLKLHFHLSCGLLHGTVTSPLTMSVGGGEAAGIAVHEDGGNKGTVTTAATGGAVGGAALGIVAAPVVGGMFAHKFVHGMDELSDQSDDEGAVIVEKM